MKSLEARNRQIADFIHSMSDSIDPNAQGIILSSGGSGPDYKANPKNCAENSKTCENDQSCNATVNGNCTNWSGACIGADNTICYIFRPNLNFSISCIKANPVENSCKPT